MLKKFSLQSENFLKQGFAVPVFHNRSREAQTLKQRVEAEGTKKFCWESEKLYTCPE